MPQLTRAEWDDIQAVIVYGYQRLRIARYLFLHVTDPAAAKRWLAGLIDQTMTVAQWETHDGTSHHSYAINLALTYPGLKALGLPEEALRTFSREFSEGIAPKPKQGDDLAPRSIVLGDTELSSPVNWEIGGFNDIDTEREIHLLVFINAADDNEMATILGNDTFKALVDNGAANGVKLISIQGGETPRTNREPFGFRDGISNPWVEGTRYSRRTGGQKNEPLKVTDQKIVKDNREISLVDDPVIKAGEFVMGYENEYGQVPPTPLVRVADDPGNTLHGFDERELCDYHDLGRNGSYLVYRKLQQDVSAFWKFLGDHAKDENGTVDRKRVEWLGAKFVGRWPSGVPMVMSPEHDNPALARKATEERNNSLINDFAYIADHEHPLDRNGLRCPVGSHIRRMNPRDALFDDQDADTAEGRYKNTRRHRIMRRAASFGKLPDHQVDPDYFNKNGAPLEVTYTLSKDNGLGDVGVGIHFFGVNANIQQQFEFIQQAWGNSGKFNGQQDNRDPLTGENHGQLLAMGAQPDAVKYAEEQVEFSRQQPSDMIIPMEPVRERIRNLPRFVTVRGGAYLFLPSMRALRFIVSRG